MVKKCVKRLIKIIIIMVCILIINYNYDVNANMNTKNSFSKDVSVDKLKKIVDVDIQDCAVSERYYTFIIDAKCSITYLDFGKIEQNIHIEFESYSCNWKMDDEYGNKIYLDAFLDDFTKKNRKAELIWSFSTYDDPNTKWNALCNSYVDIQDVTPDDIVVYEAPTCTVEGKGGKWNRNTKTFDACVIPATGHKYGNIKYLKKCGTVEEDGYERQVKKCVYCGLTKYITNKIFSAINNVYVDNEVYGHTGRAITPKVTVYTKTGIVDESNYDIEYFNNVNVGIAKIRVSFKGHYQGSMTRTFLIAPDMPIPDFSNSKKGISISWKPVKGADGYYVFAQRKTKEGWQIKKVADVKATSHPLWVDSYVKKYLGSSFEYIVVSYIKYHGKKYYSGEKKYTTYYIDAPVIRQINGTTPELIEMNIKYSSVYDFIEVQYATNPSMTNAKLKTIDSVDLLPGKFVFFSNFRRGGKYYIRIRCCLVIEGERHYSCWSNKKMAKITYMRAIRQRLRRDI